MFKKDQISKMDEAEFQNESFDSTFSCNEIP